MYSYNRYTSACLISGTACPTTGGTGFGGTAYAVVLDGYDHFNAQSTFVSQGDSVDIRQSMIGNNFLGGELQAQGTGAAVWIGGTRQMTMHETYVAAVSGTGPVIGLFCEDAVCNEDPTFDIHVEQKGTTDVFSLGGTYPTPALAGFTYSDVQAEPTNSVYKVDPTSSVTAATMTGARIKVTSFFNPTPSTPLLFDNPALWTFGGDVYLPALADWNEPATIFAGSRVCFPSLCVPYVPTEPINRNPDFVLDQPNGQGAAPVKPTSGNTLIVDGWRTRYTGNLGQVFAFQQSASSPPAGYSNYEIVTTTTALTPAAAQSYAIRSVIEGPDAAALNEGTGGAQPLSFDYCASSSIAPVTLSPFASNNGLGRSFVWNNTITAANAYQCFKNTAPGDTTASTWTKQRNRPGLVFGFGLSVGANFQTTPGAWTSGEYTGTSSTTDLAATVGTKLSLGAVHVGIGQFHMPYKAREQAKELLLDQHWYRKSFEAAVAPAQNAGAVGASVMFQQSGGTGSAQGVSFGSPLYVNNDAPAYLPTITLYSTGAATANCYDATKGADAGAASALNTGDAGFTVACAAGSAVSGGQLQVQWFADTGF